MKVMKTIRSTIALLAQRRIERMTRYTPRQVEAILAARREPAASRTAASST
jgi:hypothetical protein